MPDIFSKIQAGIWLYKACQKIPGLKGYVRALRRGAARDVLWNLHHQVTHELRKSLCTVERDGINRESMAQFSSYINATRNCVAQFMGVDHSELNATLKLVDKNDNKGFPVLTVARSDPSERAPGTAGQTYYIHENSALAALQGISDGQTTWSAPYPVFACNNLPAEPEFKCMREGWDSHFKSTIVLPLRFTDESTSKYEIHGYLTFASRNVDFFVDIPNTMKHKGRRTWGEHEKIVRESGLINLCALIADMTTCALRRHLETELETGGNNA